MCASTANRRAYFINRVSEVRVLPRALLNSLIYPGLLTCCPSLTLVTQRSLCLRQYAREAVRQPRVKRDEVRTDGTMARLGTNAYQGLMVSVLAHFVLVSLAEPTSAVAYVGSIVAQQSPYGPPATDPDLTSWLGPLRTLPLWAQASIVTALVVGAFLFVPPAVRSLSRTVRGGRGDL